MGGAISCALRVAQKARGRPFGVAGLALLGLMGLRGPSKDPARERALEEGRSTYGSSTSRKCLRGHVSERYASNKRCVECERATRGSSGRKADRMRISSGGASPSAALSSAHEVGRVVGKTPGNLRKTGDVSRLQIERPGLSDEVVAKRMVRLFVDKSESRRLIDAARRDQDVVGP